MQLASPYNRLLFAALLVYPIGPLDARAETAKEAKSNILAAWDSVLPTAKVVRWEKTVEYYRSRDGTPLKLRRKDVVKHALTERGSVFSYNVERYDEGMKVTERDEHLEMTNAQYKAVLGKGKTKDVWVLTDLKQPAPAETTDRRGVLCPWMLVCGHVLLPDWITDNRVVITRVEVIDETTTPGLLRVHFVLDQTRPITHNEPAFATIKSGSIDFDKTAHYRVAAYQFSRRSAHSEWVEKGVLEYAAAQGIPVLEKHTVDFQFAPSEKFGRRESREVHMYNLDYRADTPEDEFRLSHYGLPEPIGVTWEKPTPLYVWILLAAGLSLVLAMGFRYMGRRRSHVH